MATKSLIEPDLTHSVIGAFYEVYNTLGYGFLEHIYVRAMERELRSRGHDVGREVGVRITYKGEELGIQRLDMIVDGVLVVEIKSTHRLSPEAPRQVYNYLKASSLPIGLLLHFGPEPQFYAQARPAAPSPPNPQFKDTPQFKDKEESENTGMQE